MKNRVLIIIDMLNDFVDENGALYCGESVDKIVPKIFERLNIYRKSKERIIFLKDSHDEDDKEFERFPKHCVSGTWGSQIIPKLLPLNDETVLLKKRFSGFFRTPLEAILDGENISEVEVSGVCTSICIMDTVGGLADRDYKTRVFKNCVADFDTEFHEFALRRMEQTYGTEVR